MAYFGTRPADAPNRGLDKSLNLSDILDKDQAFWNIFPGSLAFWRAAPIGFEIGIDAHGEIPPSDDSGGVWIKLSYNDPYNSGKVTDENLSGSGATITSNGKIVVPGSYNNVVVDLINTTRHFIRPGETAGVKQEGQNAQHNHSGTADNGGAHTHTGSADSGGAHTHTGSTNSTGAHTHSVSGTAASAGAHTHSMTHHQGSLNQTNQPLSGSGSTTTVNFNTNSAGAHTHSVSGTAASNGAHSHTVTINSGGSHTHTVTINSGGAHSHTLSIANSGGDEARPRNISRVFYKKVAA